MDLISLIVILLIVGVVLAFFPIDGTIKNVILCLIVIAVILTFAHGYGGWGGARHWSW
jgi:hypothetical protein